MAVRQKVVLRSCVTGQEKTADQLSEVKPALAPEKGRTQVLR
jgi:hypothetical protein